MEMKEEQHVREFVEKSLEGNDDLFLVDVKIKGNTGNQKVLVFIDGDKGVSIDACSQLSRAVGEMLEENDVFTGKYTLEVSSPGLDFPLTLHRQYVKNIGRDLEIECVDGGKKEGKLLEVSEEMIVISRNQQDQQIKFSEIKQSKVKISFK